MTLNLVPYSEARDLLKTGDTLLMSPRIRWWFPLDYWTYMICWAAGTHVWYDPRTWLNSARHCHAAKFVWWMGQGMICQETSLDPHFLALSDEVHRWSGKIDVYRPDFFSDDNREKCARAAIRTARKKYGWRLLLRAACHHLPIVWRLLPVDTDDLEESYLPPFCSALVSYCDRMGGVDPCPKKPDRLTEPSDLAVSFHYRYLFTLVSDPNA